MNSPINSCLKELSIHKHCCNCGQINPAVGDYAGEGDPGFTLCCNEAVCKREHRYLFGDGKYSVESCCWAVAELKFQKDGVDISRLSEIRRTALD